MRRTVTIIVTFDPTEYEQIKDTDKGAIELVQMMIENEADFPPTVYLVCNGMTKRVRRRY